jgi:hypothetical protein
VARAGQLLEHLILRLRDGLAARGTGRIDLELDDYPERALACGLGDQLLDGRRDSLGSRRPGPRQQGDPEQERKTNSRGRQTLTLAVLPYSRPPWGAIPKAPAGQSYPTGVQPPCHSVLAATR